MVWSVFLVDLNVALADGGAGGPCRANVVPHHGSALRKQRLGVVGGNVAERGPATSGLHAPGQSEDLRCSRKRRTARWTAVSKSGKSMIRQAQAASAGGCSSSRGGGANGPCGVVVFVGEGHLEELRRASPPAAPSPPRKSHRSAESPPPRQSHRSASPPPRRVPPAAECPAAPSPRRPVRSPQRQQETCSHYTCEVGVGGWVRPWSRRGVCSALPPWFHSLRSLGS